MPKRWPNPEYEVRTTFRAPVKFVFRWCTDYSPHDGGLALERYERRILHRSAREVVLEDLHDTREGWIWIRRTVRLFPPNRWHADSIGSDRRVSADYRLSPLAGGRTQLTIRARRRPYGIGRRNPSKSEWERRVAGNWKRFGRALERDYRRSRANP